MSLEKATNNRNWVAVHMYDGIYPLTEEESFAESLMSIEIISQLHKKRKLINDVVPRFIRNMFGHGADDQYGERSSEGHYTVWIHLSDQFLASNDIESFGLERQMFMYPDSKTDIFTAFSGDVNLASLLTKGVVGFTDPIKEGDGFAGKFQSFDEIAEIGEADYEAGWFMNDDQTFRMLDAIMRYEGIKKGYTFLSKIGDYPDHLFDPTGNRMGNGRNCGDFLWYLLDKSGVVPKEISKQLQIQLRYPESFFDTPLPLSPAGQKGVKWLAENEGASLIPDEVMAKLVGMDLLFGKHGVEFFDKRRIVEEIEKKEPRYRAAHIWEHANVIEWLRNPLNRHFKSKGIVTELLPAVREGRPIYSPHRTVEEDASNRYVLSPNYTRLQEKGNKYRQRKLEKAGLGDDRHLELRALEKSLYDRYIEFPELE